MKKADIILFATAFAVFVGLLSYIGALVILRVAVCLIVIGLVLNWKILTYKNQLYPQYAKVADSIGEVINPLLQLLNKMPNIQLGDKLFVDTKYLVICSLLLLLLIII